MDLEKSCGFGAIARQPRPWQLPPSVRLRHGAAGTELRRRWSRRGSTYTHPTRKRLRKRAGFQPGYPEKRGRPRNTAVRVQSPPPSCSALCKGPRVPAGGVPTRTRVSPEGWLSWEGGGHQALASGGQARGGAACVHRGPARPAHLGSLPPRPGRSHNLPLPREDVTDLESEQGQRRDSEGGRPWTLSRGSQHHMTPVGTGVHIGNPAPPGTCPPLPAWGPRPRVLSACPQPGRVWGTTADRSLH